MRKSFVVAIALCSAGLLAAPGCNNKDKAKETPAKVDPKPLPKPEPPKPPPAPKKVTAEERAARHQECMGFWSAKDAEKFKTCMAPEVTVDMVDSGMPVTSGIEASIAPLKQFWAAFPDAKAAPQLVLVEGNTIVSIELVTATNSGDSPMMPKTGKKVGYLMSHVIDTNDAGLATKITISSDMGTMMGQLGVSPAPHREPLETLWPAPVVVVAKGSPEEAANRAVAKEGVDKVNAHDIDGMLATLTDDSLESDLAAPKDAKGKKDIKKGLANFFKAFSDLNLTVDRELAAGDYVVHIGSFTGTNSGAMPAWGLKKATKKAVKLAYLEIKKVTGGKVAETWRFHNGMAMAIQLGMMAPPPTVHPGTAPADGAAPAAPAAGDGKAAGAAPKGGKGAKVDPGHPDLDRPKPEVKPGEAKPGDAKSPQ